MQEQTGFYGNGAQHIGGPGGIFFTPGTSQYSNARSRDATHFGALGRAELDARTQSPYGTVRAFIRVDSYYGSGGNSATGSLGSLGNTFNTTAGASSQRESTIVNKAFIQFVGLTAGRAQSFFDFYADAYNYASLRGSNATTALFAYTASFGQGFSASLSSLFANTALGTPPTAYAFPAESDTGVRRAVVGALGFSAVAQAAEAVASALGDCDWQVREIAAETIGKVGHRAAIPALISTLGDDSWQVRQKAIRSLGKLRVREAVPAVASALDEQISNLRKEAAAALGEIADVAALPYLDAHAEDLDPDVRKTVRWAIGRLV